MDNCPVVVTHPGSFILGANCHHQHKLFNKTEELNATAGQFWIIFIIFCFHQFLVIYRQTLRIIFISKDDVIYSSKLLTHRNTKNAEIY